MASSPEPSCSLVSRSIIRVPLVPACAFILACLIPLVDAQAPVDHTDTRSRLQLYASHAASGRDDQDRTGLDPNSPIFRKLLAGIIYSKYLVQTYYYVLAAILLVFALANWLPRAATWFKRRISKRHGVQSHSIVTSDRAMHNDSKELFKNQIANSKSSSSSLGGSSSASTASQASDEHTPLIVRPEGQHVDRRSVPKRCWDRCNAWLMYQPESLPGFRNRVMPSNATTVLVSLYLSINIFYLLFNIELSVDLTFFILADRAAQLFVTNVPLLYILSAKNQPLQPVIGYSYASLNIVHRRLGEWMCVLAAVHGFGMIIMWATLLRPSGYHWTKFFGDQVVLLGLGALFCYEAIGLSSIATIRQKSYELFLATHVALQVGALGFLYFHHSKSRPYVSIALGVWGLDRFIYRLWAKTQSFKAALSVLHDEDTISVVVSVPFRKRSMFRHILGLHSIRDGWKALDHIFLTIPALSNRHMVQAHPFSIASEAPSPDDASSDLELIIRARNGFTRDLRNYTNEHDFVNVRIDGPYGTHAASRLLAKSDVRIVIAGGSGIAVTYPLLEQLIATEDMAAFADIERAPRLHYLRPVLFVWVVHSREQWTWSDLQRLQELGQRAGIEVVLPLPTREARRPDLKGVITEWLETTAAPGEKQGRIGVVVSGPDDMSREVRNQCAAMKGNGQDVRLEFEKYGW